VQYAKNARKHNSQPCLRQQHITCYYSLPDCASAKLDLQQT
jgi:hypothetical protein